MRTRQVTFSRDAKDDLFDLYNRLIESAGPDVALAYIERLEEFCKGFEKRITIAFTVDENEVTILRLFYGGQDWSSKM